MLRQWRLRALIRLGDLEPARAALAEATNEAQWCSLAAHLRLADGDAEGAVAALAPALDGSAFAFHPNQVIEALLLDAHARTRLGEREAAERSVERALDLAEAGGTRVDLAGGRRAPATCWPPTRPTAPGTPRSPARSPTGSPAAAARRASSPSRSTSAS